MHCLQRATLNLCKCVPVQDRRVHADLTYAQYTCYVSTKVVNRVTWEPHKHISG